MIVIAGILTIALLIIILTNDDLTQDDTGGYGAYDHSGMVNLTIHNTQRPGDVSIYADGTLIGTIYLEKGESHTYQHEVNRLVRWTAVHQEGFTDSDDAGPGSQVSLII
jgi:hypothetical protein